MDSIKTMSGIRRQMGTREWALLLALGMIWGSSFFFNAVALKELPPLMVVALRLSVGTTFLWAAVLTLGYASPTRWSDWRDILVLALINNIVPFTLIAWGQTEIASGVAAILNATTPFFTLIVAHAFTNDEPMRPGQIAGVAVALAGVACMMGMDVISGLGSDIVGEFAVLGAAFCYGMAGVWGRRLAHHPPLISAASQTLSSSLILLPLALLLGGKTALFTAGATTLLAILGQGVLCTSVAYVLFFLLLRSSGAGNVSLVTLIVPVNAILLGSLVLGEPLLLRHILGMSAVAMGLALIDGRITRRLFAT